VRAHVWGCRGSLASPGPKTVRYGGNTSCVELRSGDTVLVLDAGTGIRPLGIELDRQGVRLIHLLLTHLHIDHVEGLGFFGPIWHAETELHIWGPPSPLLSLRERIARSFSPPLFPIDMRDIPAQVTFHDVPREPWSIVGAALSADLVVHPGPTVGFRIETPDASFAYLPDHEPALAGWAGRSRDWISGAAIAADADLLLHDAQYFEDEYVDRIGWGHSSVADAVGYADAVGARRLLLSHHEPAHTDEALERLEAEARSLAAGDSDPPALAREGMVLELASAA
jgi:phosphoribosyl 1,2-cyclic phosphodiesterase